MAKDALIFIIVHNHRLYSGIQNFYSGFSFQYRFLDGKTGHAFQQLRKLLLSGNKVAKRIKDQHFVSVIVRHASIWLKYMRMTADYNIDPCSIRKAAHCF